MSRKARFAAVFMLACALAAPMAHADKAPKKPKGSGLSAVFCGSWTSPSSTVKDDKTKLTGGSSAGMAYTDSCGGTQDGTYTWSLAKGKLDDEKDKGKEKGAFTWTGSQNWQGKFKGKLRTFMPVNCTATSASALSNTIYASDGEFKAKSDTSKWSGRYTVAVTSDVTSGDGTCHFEASLSGDPKPKGDAATESQEDAADSAAWAG